MISDIKSACTDADALDRLLEYTYLVIPGG
jgi:hypothetical protein